MRMMCNDGPCEYQTSATESFWGTWGACSVTCGIGVRGRIKMCNEKYCTGPSSETQDCHLQPCSQPSAHWNVWSEWSPCPVSCGEGVTQRRRTCPSGSTCQGLSVQEVLCGDADCSPIWEAWTSWSDCSRSCGVGMYTRSRSCLLVTGCAGTDSETNPCSRGDCNSDEDWTNWCR